MHSSNIVKGRENLQWCQQREKWHCWGFLKQLRKTVKQTHKTSRFPNNIISKGTWNTCFIPDIKFNFRTLILVPMLIHLDQKIYFNQSAECWTIRVVTSTISPTKIFLLIPYFSNPLDTAVLQPAQQCNNSGVNFIYSYFT